MANTPIQVIVQILTDTKGVAAGSRELAKLGKIGEKVGADVAASFEKASAAQKKAAATSKQAASAATKQANASRNVAKSNKDAYVTTQQLAKENRFLANAWRDGSHVIDNRYLKSISGLREGMKKFNKESQQTLVYHKGLLTTLDDGSQKWNRFLMKGNLVTRTLHNMSTNMVNLGKNAQWTGRQMMVGITLPIVGVGAAAVKSYQEIAKLDLAIRKLLQGEAGGAKLAESLKILDDQSKKLAETMGITRVEVKSMQGDFASMGFNPGMIKQLTQISTEFEKLANIDQDSATDMTRVLAQRYAGKGMTDKDVTKNVRNSLEKLNLIENKTALNSADVVGQFSEIFPIFDQFNVTAPQTIALLAAFKQQGVDPSQGATALKNALTKLAPAMSDLNKNTKGSNDRLKYLRDTLRTVGEQYGIAFDSFDEKSGKPRSAVDLLLQVSTAYKKLTEDADSGSDAANTLRNNLMRSLFVGGRSNEGYALFDSLSKSMDPLLSKSQDFSKAWAIATDKGKEATSVWSQQLATYMGDPSVKFANQIERMKVQLQELGRMIVPPLTKLITKINDFISKFDKMSDSSKKKILMLIAAIAALGPAVYIYGQALLFIGTIAKGLVMPFQNFFKIKSKFIDMSDGVNPLIEKLNGLTDAWKETGDPKLLPQIKDSMDELAKRPAIAEAATASIQAQTAAQEALNSAEERGQDISLRGARGREIAVPESVAGLRKTSRASREGLEAAEGFDPSVDAEVEKRVAAARRKAVEKEYRDLIDRDKGINADGSKRFNAKRVIKPKKAKSLEKKVVKAEEALDALSDDKIEALAVELAEGDIGATPDITGVERGRERIKGLRERISQFEKSWGVKAPIYPDTSIKDSAARFDDFERRWGVFEQSATTSAQTIAGNSGGKFKGLSLEETHGIIKDAIAESNGKGIGVPDASTGRKAARELLADATSKVDVDAPPLMNDRVVDQIRQALQAGVLSPDALSLDTSINDAVEEALAHPEGWKAWVAEDKKKPKNQRRGGDVEKIIKSFINRDLGGTRGGVASKQNELAKIKDRLEKVKAGINKAELEKAADIQRALDSPAAWKELEKIEKSDGSKNGTLTPERKKRRDDLRMLINRVEEQYGGVLEEGSVEETELRKELARTKKSSAYKSAQKQQRKVAALRAEVKAKEVEILEASEKLKSDRIKNMRDPGSGARTPRLRTGKSGVAQRMQTTTRELLSETDIGPGSEAGKDYVDKKIKSAKPGREFMAELLPEDTAGARDALGYDLFQMMEQETGIDPKGKNIPTSVMSEWRAEFDKRAEALRLKNVAANNATRAKAGERKAAYVKDWVRRYHAGEVKSSDGMPEDLKKALAGALFGGMEEGNVSSGGGRGRKKGYRKLIREALGETAYTPLEDDALQIINETAADMSKSIPSATRQDTDEFRNRAKRNRKRGSSERSRFAGGLGSRLRKKDAGTEAMVRKEMGQNIDKEIAQIQGRMSSDKARLEQKVAQLTAAKKAEQDILSEMEGKISEEVAKVDQAGEIERARIVKERDNNLKNIGTKGKGVKALRDAEKSAADAKLKALDEQLAKNRVHAKDSAVRDVQGRAAKPRLEQRAIQGEIDRAESRIGKTASQLEGAQRAKANIGGPVAEGTDYFDDVVKRREAKLVKDQKKVDDTIKKINNLKKREAAQIRRIERDVERKLAEMPTKGEGSMNARKAVREAGEARKAAARDKNSQLFQILNEQFTDQANTANDTRRRVEEAKRIISVGGTDDLAILNQALSDETDEKGRFTGRNAIDKIADVKGSKRKLRSKSKNLKRLVGSLSPEMAQTIEEFMVADTRGTYDDALKLVRQYQPEIADDLAREYASKVVEVRNAIENQFDEAKHYLGGGDSDLNKREQMVRARRGRSTTLDNIGSEAEMEASRAQGALSFDDVINEDARKGTGGTPSGTSQQGMVDDLMSGFAADREVQAENLTKEHERAKKQLRISENRIEELKQEEEEEFDKLHNMSKGTKSYDRQERLIQDIQNERAEEEAKLPKLREDASASSKPLLEAMVDAEDEQFEGKKKKVANAEDRLQTFEDELARLDDEQVEANSRHQKRRAAKIGAAKRKLRKERDAAAKLVEAAKQELDEAYTTVYEVFDLDKGELVQYKSLDEYREARRKQAEKIVEKLDMSDIEEAERNKILAELDKSAAREEANARQVERKMLNNKRKRRGFFDRWRKAGAPEEFEGLAESAAADVADGPDGPVVGGNDGFIKRAATKVGKGAEKKAVSKKKGGLLNPVNLVNMINPLKTVTAGTEEAAGAVGKLGMAAETSGTSFAALFPSLQMLPELLAPFAPIAIIIIAIGAVIAVLALNFKKWEKSASKGINKVKSAFKGLIGAIVGPFKGLWQSITGSSEKAGNKTGNMWKNVGKVLGRVFEIVAGIIKFITPIVSAVMQVVTKGLYILVQVFRVVMAVFSGDWEDAWQGIQNIWDVIWWGIKKTAVNAFILIWKGCSMVVKGIVNALGKLFGALSHIPGVGKHISGWSDAMKDFNTSVDENTKRMSKNADNWIGTDPLKAKKKGKDAAKNHKKGAEDENKKNPTVIDPPVVDDQAAEESGKDAVQKFIDTFQGQLQKVVDGWKTAAMDAFEDYSKTIIDGIEKRIKAIDDEVEAEQKRAEDLDYLARKDELRAQRRAALLKYHAAYDSAVYEGKYDEAKQLTIDHQDEMDNIDKDEQQTDEDRQKQLTDRARDEAKKRLEIEKDNAQKILDVRKDQLQAQLDAMTEYIPKNVAEAQRMHEAIQAKMREYTNGYGKIGSDQASNWNKSWASAFAATKNQIAQEAYWSGDAAMKYFAAALGVELTDKGTGAAGASGADSGSSGNGTKPGHQGWIDKNEYHTGGQVGPQNSNPHDIPATLQSGEFVIKRNTVKSLGADTLHHINERAELPEYHTGGYVSPNASKGQKSLAGRAMSKSFSKAKDLWAKGKAKLNFGGVKASVDDYKSALQAAASGGMAGMEGGETAPGEYASGLNKEFVRRFQSWNKEMGGKFSIGSGFRTMAEQARLYARWLNHVPGQAKAAPPGKSNHNFGLAIDLSPSSTSASERAAGAKYGLRWPMSFEPWHVEPVEAKQWREQMRAGIGVGGGTVAAGLLKIRDGLVAGGGGTSAGGAVAAGPMEHILKTIRTLESGGNYSARSKYSTASGAYQFTNGTWHNYGGYPTAANAPAAVQDARAAQDVRGFLQAYKNDLRAVPGNWYSPAVYRSGQWDQPMGKGNPLTMRKYIDKWMGVYNSIKEYHKGGLVNLPAMKKGGYVVEDGIAQVHAGETMLTKKLTDQLSNSNMGGDTYRFDLHFDGGFFGTDRDLEKLQLKLEQDIVPKIQKAQGMKKSTFKGVTK